MPSLNRPNLVDRQREIRELRELASSPQPQMGLLYGRRRVGKTYLLQHAWGRWEGVDRNRDSVEVDIVAELHDGRTLTGEVKWSSSPVDIDLHFSHLASLQALAKSGQRWAHNALEEESSAGHLYVSAAGFTEAFYERSSNDDSIRLVELADLYAG